MVFCNDGGLQSNNRGLGVVATIENIAVLETQFKLPNFFNKYTSHRCKEMELQNLIVLFGKMKHFRKKDKRQKYFKQVVYFTVIMRL
jgi:hypothetical protein